MSMFVMNHLKKAIAEMEQVVGAEHFFAREEEIEPRSGDTMKQIHAVKDYVMAFTPEEATRSSPPKAPKRD